GSAQQRQFRRGPLLDVAPAHSLCNALASNGGKGTAGSPREFCVGYFAEALQFAEGPGAQFRMQLGLADFVALRLDRFERMTGLSGDFGVVEQTDQLDFIRAPGFVLRHGRQAQSASAAAYCEWGSIDALGNRRIGIGSQESILFGRPKPLQRIDWPMFF